MVPPIRDLGTNFAVEREYRPRRPPGGERLEDTRFRARQSESDGACAICTPAIDDMVRIQGSLRRHWSTPFQLSEGIRLRS